MASHIYIYIYIYVGFSLYLCSFDMCKGKSLAKYAGFLYFLLGCSYKLSLTPFWMVCFDLYFDRGQI